MPRYYFDIDDGKNFVRDAEGIVFDDISAARDEAMRALPLIASEESATADIHEVIVHIRDEGGKVLYRTTLSITSNRAN